MSEPLHPAPYSAEILELIEREKLLPETGIVIDPFAGVGRIHRLATDTRKTIGVEIESEWADAHPDTRVGDATKLPFGASCFDAACTSPCYGNRYSDHHRARDGSYRRSYTHDLRKLTGNEARQLHRNNAGRYKGNSDDYWRLHGAAWRELRRVLRPGAPFVLNVSDYVANGYVVPIVDSHAALLTLELDFVLVDRFEVKTRRMRRGANSAVRVDCEVVLVFEVPR